MDTQLANYLAGQFDARGSVAFTRHTNGRTSNQIQNRLHLSLYVPTIDAAEHLYLLIDCRGTLLPSKRGSSARIDMSCAMARQFLNEIIEFTHIKKQVIQDALDQDARLVEPQA